MHHIVGLWAKVDWSKLDFYLSTYSFPSVSHQGLEILEHIKYLILGLQSKYSEFARMISSIKVTK
uniref:Putative ovule protein n=1 Tax=Solanum chacoense TaxID=4108 RepID=A0A0V0GVB3_SOLCH